ncbi:MAG: hypothetical protein ACO3K7_02695 [Candidatus Marinamargulisbacteria bacterium]
MINVIGSFIMALSVVIWCADFRDDVFKLNVTYNDTEWVSQPTEKYRQRLILKHHELPATINLLAYRFSETITANGLVRRRIQSVYDGWQLLAETPLSPIQALKKNITEGRQSVYRKVFLDQELNEQQQLVGEMAMVTDDTLAIIMNLSVDTPAHFLQLKESFNQLTNRLWFGDQKPRFNVVVSQQNEWVRKGQNFTRRRAYDSDALFQDTSQLITHLPVDIDFRRGDLSIFSNKNGQYLLVKNQLAWLDSYTQTVQTYELPLYKPTIELTSDGFWAIQRHPFLQIKKYTSDFTETMTFQDNHPAQHVIPLSDAFVTINDHHVRLISSVIPEWTFDHSLDRVHVVADLNQLILADNHHLIFLNLTTGMPTGRYELSRILPDFNGELMDMVIHQGQLLILMRSGDKMISGIIDIQTHQRVNHAVMSDINTAQLVGVSEHVILMQYQTLQGDHRLEAFDFNTFASIWSRPFENGQHPVVLNQRVLFSNSLTNNLESMDFSLAGTISTLNVSELIPSQNSTSFDPAMPYQVLGIVPLKSKFLTIIGQENHMHAIYFR